MSPQYKHLVLTLTVPLPQVDPRSMGRLICYANGSCVPRGPSWNVLELNFTEASSGNSDPAKSNGNVFAWHTIPIQ